MPEVCTEQWIADRARLRVLHLQHPEWTQCRLAQEIGRSRGWVQKWLRRFREVDPTDQTVIMGHSSRPRAPFPTYPEEVEAKIVSIRGRATCPSAAGARTKNDPVFSARRSGDASP